MDCLDIALCERVDVVVEQLNFLGAFFAAITFLAITFIIAFVIYRIITRALN